MKLLIRQRVFSWSDTYDVYDEDGQPKYYVRAEILSRSSDPHLCACNRAGGGHDQREAFDVHAEI